ncbi:MAG: thymidine kinase [Bacteroidota bacterium]
MFIEPYHHRPDGAAGFETGWIEVICGSMFSGKTEELIRRLKRAQLARMKVEIFKPVVDTRYHIENIVSHNHNSIRSTPVTSAKEIALRSTDCDLVGIDEAQFFDDSLIEVCEFLAGRGKRVVVAGLDMDFAGKPFGPMPAMLAIAEYVTKVHAICMRCGSLASFSYRLVHTNQQFLLGEQDAYEARCRRCFLHGMEQNG